MADLCKIENEKEYYKALRESLDHTTMWNNPQYKSDYDSRMAVFGYQETARMMAGEIAEKLAIRNLRKTADLAGLLLSARRQGRASAGPGVSRVTGDRND